MALLDVLTVIFEADATKLNKGAEETEKTIEDTKHAVTDTDKAAESLGNTFVETIGSAKAAIAGLVSLGTIAASVVAQAAATDELGKFSDRLGLNIEQVSSWGRAVARSGGSMEGFRGSVENLNDNLSELAYTGGGPAAEAFARLGITAADSEGRIKGVFDLLPEIATQFEGLSQAQSVELGKKLGLDQATILVLQQGRQALEAQLQKQKELGIATEEDAAIAETFNHAMKDLQQVFGSLSREVGAFLLPAMSEILAAFGGVVQFLRDHKELVVGFFVAVAGILTGVYLPAAIAAAAATIAANAPLILLVGTITAISAAFALLYDDIQNFLQGNDSLIGQFTQRWPFIGDLIRGIVDIAKEFFSIFQQIASFVGGAFLDTVQGVFNILGKNLQFFLDGIQSAVDLFGKAKDFFGFGGEVVSEAAENPRQEQGVFGLLGDAKEFLGLGGEAIQQAAQNPLSGQTAQSIQSNSRTENRQTTVSVGAVNVDARGGDSGEISAGIGNALNDQMQIAVSNFDDGVAY